MDNSNLTSQHMCLTPMVTPAGALMATASVLAVLEDSEYIEDVPPTKNADPWPAFSGFQHDSGSS